jgi:hypothetical protein
MKNKIDEIYCSLEEVSDTRFEELIEFADENIKQLSLFRFQGSL